MLRTASRVVPRQAWRLATPRASTRHLSTAPPHQLSRSWKNSAVRWGIAIAGIYWYNTSTVFAEEPPARLLTPRHDDETSTLPTLDSLSPSARRKRDVHSETSLSPASTTQIASAEPATSGMPPADDIEGLEDEAHSEGAFNPETGEINWDCPCLGGMAHGPCGPEFREAFSCFVFSTEEPKGMDCIERFKTMQNCFRQHPDVYGAELEGDEDEDEEDVHGVGHEDAGVAAAPPEDAPQVAALAEKIKEEQKSRATDASAATGQGEDAQVSAKKAAAVPASNEQAAKESSADPSTSTPSKLPREPQADQRHTLTENEALEEAIVPRAAHDARNAPVPKQDK